MKLVVAFIAVVTLAGCQTGPVASPQTTQQATAFSTAAALPVTSPAVALGTERPSPASPTANATAGATGSATATSAVPRLQLTGRMLFTRSICHSETDLCWEIVAADLSDSSETVLAGPFARGVWDDHFIANWAPDGGSAVFMADLGDGQAIWQVNSDGSGMRKIFVPPADTGLDDGPAFTPDGKRIIFTRCCPSIGGYGLWSVSADGTDLKIVNSETVPPGVDGPSDNLPQVSPDGQLVAFHRNLNNCGCYIATVPTSGGSDLRGLTDPALNGQIPNWSPDSSRIVFDAEANVWVVNADGTGPHALTSDSGATDSGNASYSPDGKKIVFAHFGGIGGTDLYVMNADGTDIEQLTNTSTSEFWPHWIPK